MIKKFTGSLLQRMYRPGMVRQLMDNEEPLLNPEPFAALLGCHVEDLVPLYKRDRDRLLGEFYD